MPKFRNVCNTCTDYRPKWAALQNRNTFHKQLINWHLQGDTWFRKAPKKTSYLRNYPKLGGAGPGFLDVFEILVTIFLY